MDRGAVCGPTRAAARTPGRPSTSGSTSSGTGGCCDYRDLSGYQNLGRPRDRLIRVSQPLLRRAAPHNRWRQMLVGGNALQDTLRRGLLHHRELVFVRE